MKVNVYVINKTYIAEDNSTGLRADGKTADEAERKLKTLLAEYWEERKIVVPIQHDDGTSEDYEHPVNTGS